MIDNLRLIAPQSLSMYMDFLGYNKLCPTSDAQPTLLSSSMLLYMKKTISKFMLRSKVLWDPVGKEVNPTHSTEESRFITRAKNSK